MERPLLFDVYPQAKDNLPWVSLGDFPTPIERLEKLGEKLDHPSLWVKRDDLSSNKMGGNKVRVMEFLLAKALAQDKKTAISTGALGSNQIMASAIYGNQLGLKIEGLFFKQCDTDYMCKHMLIDKCMDVEFHHINNPYLVPFYILYYYLRNVDWKRMQFPFYIPTFGSSATCALGYFNAMLELKQQIDHGQMPEPDYIFVTAGTGGTMAGIQLGAKVLGLKTKVIGVRIADYIAINEYMLANIINRTNRCLTDAGAPLGKLKLKAKDVTLIHEFFGGEYARITDEGMDAKNLLQELEDLTLDTTYTAKTMAAMVKYLSEHDLSDKTMLFWHTYNTRDLSPFLDKKADYKQLPEEFHCYFQNPSA